MTARYDRLARLVRAGIHGLGAFAFPAPCLLCHELLRRPLLGPLCELCIEVLPRIEPPFCESCGLPYAASVAPGYVGRVAEASGSSAKRAPDSSTMSVCGAFCLR